MKQSLTIWHRLNNAKMAGKNPDDNRIKKNSKTKTAKFCQSILLLEAKLS